MGLQARLLEVAVAAQAELLVGLQVSTKMAVLVGRLAAVVGALPNHILAAAVVGALSELSGDQVDHSPQLIQVTCNGTLHSYCKWATV